MSYFALKNLRNELTNLKFVRKLSTLNPPKMATAMVDVNDKLRRVTQFTNGLTSLGGTLDVENGRVEADK
jgi:hypothetical protein